MVGISGVGKSTLAYQIIKNDAVITSNTNYVMVSRDKLREMLFAYNEDTVQEYYEHPLFNKRERIISKHVNELIEYNLHQGLDVIYDATNLKMDYINRLIKKFYYTDIEFIDVVKHQSFDERDLLKLCIERDSLRTRKVGSKVIKRQYNQYKSLLKTFDFETYKTPIKPIIQDMTKPKCVVFDVDGTLAERVGRSPFDWLKVDTDTCNEYVANIMRYYINDPTYRVFVCTGRDGVSKDLTVNWLFENNLNGFDQIYTRPEDNYEKDYVIKQRMWEHIANSYYIECLFDDRSQVIEHGCMVGLNMINVKGIKQDF